MATNKYTFLYVCRFFTGNDVWSAYVNITKCKIKGDITPQGARSPRPGAQQMAGSACPLRISVAPRRPPNYMDPKTRKINCLVNNYNYLPDRCSLDLYPEENTWHYITAIPTLSDKIIAFAISVVITDCPHPRVKANHLLINKIDLHQICSGGNSRAAFQLVFPPYNPGFDVDHWSNRKCGQR